MPTSEYMASLAKQYETLNKLIEEAENSKIRKIMSKRFNVEISGAFGLDILRIGQMGEQCRSHNLFKVLYALGMSCRQEGINLDVSLGMAELERNLMIDPENLLD